MNGWQKLTSSLPKDGERVYLKVSGFTSECLFDKRLFDWRLKALYGNGEIVLKKGDPEVNQAEWRQVEQGSDSSQSSGGEG